ncbi:MAG: formyltetrahydrofolate deformylase [Alphaproteobacteria bacterium]|nr:formyltetrahydrofolate deformylase [Alphaproteobacteria bacterium]
MYHDRYILTLSCVDSRGIVAAVTTFLTQQYGFIIESGQFGDASTQHFFMRVEFSLQAGAPSLKMLRSLFAEQVGAPFDMRWDIFDKNKKARVLVLVSKQGHCLHDLLYRTGTHQLPIEIPAIISNHPDMASLAEWHKVPYHQFAEGESKPEQEKKILALVEQHHIDVVVLARYMQILSPELAAKLSGRAINIHHSFLPSFKGARPYHQAFDRGVKLIGATAHYVTDELDEGPIIEQEVARVDHAHTPDDLAAIGRDIECQVLTRALKYHVEHRVVLNGKKTVVFR